MKKTDGKITEVDEELEQMTESKKCNLSKEIASIEHEYQSLNIENSDSIKENFAILEKEFNQVSHKDELLKTIKSKNAQPKQFKHNMQKNEDRNNSAKRAKKGRKV